jgi:hypothetical protein
MLKGAGTLPARLPVARHSKDIDLYYAERAAEPNAAVAALARVADRDVGDHFRFELTKTTPLQETAKGRWVHPLHVPGQPLRNLPCGHRGRHPSPASTTCATSDSAADLRTVQGLDRLAE